MAWESSYKRRVPWIHSPPPPPHILDLCFWGRVQKSSVFSRWPWVIVTLVMAVVFEKQGSPCHAPWPTLSLQPLGSFLLFSLKHCAFTFAKATRHLSPLPALLSFCLAIADSTSAGGAIRQPEGTCPLLSASRETWLCLRKLGSV